TGIAVNIGARVAAVAEPGEVLVTGTVRDLVAGSGLEFADRGARELRGIPGPWKLYALSADTPASARTGHVAHAAAAGRCEALARSLLRRLRGRVTPARGWPRGELPS